MEEVFPDGAVLRELFAANFNGTESEREREREREREKG